ncbi:MAG: hypothetical protein OXF74_06725 [Rhodobacteraceae bacterium]|nr:hypothetical protein [Paracoccaceae bacterium]
MTGNGQSRFIGNLVLRVEAYGNDGSGDGNYPGTVRGQVMGGLLNGRTVSVAVRKTPTNQRVPRIADLQDESKLSFTGVGGYVALEGVRSEGGILTAQWLNRMGNADAEIRSGMPMQIAPAYDRDGNTRRFKVNGATVHNAQILHIEGSATATDLKALKAALGSALESQGAAFVALTPGDTHTVQRKTFLAVPGWRNGERVAVGETIENFLARHKDESIDGHFKSGQSIDVIPMEILRLGSRVCESIDAGAKYAVPMQKFLTGGLGARIASSLRRIDPAQVERFETAFLARSHDNAKEAFASLGWKGVWNSDISRFFTDAGIELPPVPRFGYAISTAFLRPYADGESRYLAKARAFTSALPRSAVPTPSDPEAHMRHYSHIFEAVTQLAESLPDSPRATPAIEKRPMPPAATPEPAAENAFGNDSPNRYSPEPDDLLDF